MRNLNAELFPRGKNTLLECLQFGGNREFWDGFQNKDDIRAYFQICYEYSVRKVGYFDH